MEIAPYIAAIVLLLLLLWFFVGVLHEAGHALAALLLLAGPVTVHLGTYGQPTGNWQFRVGRLRVYLAYNVLLWRGGYCECPANATAPVWKQRIFILAGALFPLLLTGVGMLVSFAQPNYAWRALAIVLLAIAVLGLINLLPFSKAIVLADGRRAYSDGWQLKNIQHLAGLRASLTLSLQQAEAHRLAGEYTKSAELYVAILPQARATHPLLSMAIRVLCLAGRYAEALALSTQHHRDFAAEITPDDRFGHALLLSRTDQPVLANEWYSTLIDQPQPYPAAYVNRGYTHNLLGNYALALADFDQAILLEIELAYAYANRGLARIKLGQEAAGLADIAHGLQLQPTNAYAYRSLGIYHFDRDEYAEALAHFAQARLHDPATHGLERYEQAARAVPQPLAPSPVERG